MSKQDNHEPNNQQPLIEDLTVNEDQAEAVKGGDFRNGTWFLRNSNCAGSPD